MVDKLKIYDITEHYFRDERGWRISPLVPEFSRISGEGQLHIVSLIPGAVRGNHVHTTTSEWIVFWGSETLLVWEEKGTVEEKILEKDKAYLVFIPENVCHACRNTGRQESFLFSYYDKKIKNYTEETIKKVLL